MEIFTMSEFLSLWADGVCNFDFTENQNQCLVGFRMYKKAVATKVIRLNHTQFFSVNHRGTVNIYFQSVATSLVEQIAIFVCTYFPAYLLFVTPTTHRNSDFSSICIFYVGVQNESFLPVPPNESSETISKLNMHSFFTSVEYEDCVYLSEIVFLRYCDGYRKVMREVQFDDERHQYQFFDRHETMREQLSMTREHSFSLATRPPLSEMDRTTYSELSWKYIWRPLLLVFRRNGLDNLDLIREIGAFF